VVSPVADDLAVVYLPLLPVGLWELMRRWGSGSSRSRTTEYPTLGCNVLAVRPGVVIVADGNPVTRPGSRRPAARSTRSRSARSARTARAARRA
jgi:N-dimethylarginine dimethylaminohydrolase